MENEGVASRDFIFAEDIAEGLVACALKGVAGEAYNIASGQETSIRELAERINALTGNPTPVTLLPKRSWDNSGKRYGSTAKSERALGFKATAGLPDGLARTVAWMQENIGLIERNIAKHAIHLQGT